MSGVTITTPPAPATAPNAPVVETTPTITGGVQIKEGQATQTPPVSTEEKPKLAGKFENVEALEKAYKELETKLGAPKAPEPPAKPAAGTVEASGLDFNAIADEYTNSNGALSEATTKTLTDKGLTLETVKAFVAGQAAIAKQARAEFVQIAGSEETLTSVVEWAKDPNNIPEAEAKAYDAAVNRGDQTVAKMLWQNIVNRYQAVNGNDPKLVSGSTVPGPGGVKPFANYDQVVAAMSDPRYDSDAAYRDEVIARIARSPNLA